jgi:hypothetical protein
LFVVRYQLALCGQKVHEWPWHIQIDQVDRIFEVGKQAAEQVEKLLWRAAAHGQIKV